MINKLNNYILKNIKPNEKLKIICRDKDIDIDIDETSYEIYKIIENSETNEYIKIGSYEDEYMDIYEVYYLNIDYSLLNSNISNKFNSKQKKLIELALYCEVEDIRILLQ